MGRMRLMGLMGERRRRGGGFGGGRNSPAGAPALPVRCATSRGALVHRFFLVGRVISHISDRAGRAGLVRPGRRGLRHAQSLYMYGCRETRFSRRAAKFCGN
jgi:hypothetical protein